MHAIAFYCWFYSLCVFFCARFMLLVFVLFCVIFFFAFSLPISFCTLETLLNHSKFKQIDRVRTVILSIIIFFHINLHHHPRHNLLLRVAIFLISFCISFGFYLNRDPYINQSIRRLIVLFHLNKLSGLPFFLSKFVSFIKIVPFVVSQPTIFNYIYPCARVCVCVLYACVCICNFFYYVFCNAINVGSR